MKPSSKRSRVRTVVTIIFAAVVIIATGKFIGIGGIAGQATGQASGGCGGGDEVRLTGGADNNLAPPSNAAPVSTSFNLAASTNPPGQLSTNSIPQFVTVTFDDAVTPYVIQLYQQIMSNKHSATSGAAGCYIKSTWFVSISQSPNTEVLNKCELISGLRKGQHEIASHTYGHLAPPSEFDISNAIDHLVDECGVPRNEIVGFRTPYLNHDQSTFDHLKSLGLLYDSSITEHRANAGKGSNYIFPYTMDSGIQQDCTASSGLCDQSKQNPGLWEIPMWAIYDASGNQLTSMDYPGDAYSTMQANFEKRYNGNRAPLGIFLHASWLQSNGADFNRWIGDILAKYDDVYFITNRELISWMQNPVSKDNYAMDCTGQVHDCFPPSTGCGHGSFDASTCQCACSAPYCLNAAGACLAAAPNCAGGSTPATTPTQPTQSGSGVKKYYANWSKGTCVNDGNQPSWESNLYDTLSECCAKHFSWKEAACVGSGGGDSSSTPSPIHGGWSDWSLWGPCSANCGDGTQSRNRSCNNPTPTNGGNTCTGASAESRACNLGACAAPIDGGWSAWSSWGTCSKACGGGVQESTRVCDNPTPQHGGNACTGATMRTQSCNSQACSGATQTPSGAQCWKPQWSSNTCSNEGASGCQWWTPPYAGSKEDCCKTNFGWGTLTAHCIKNSQ